MAVRLEAGSDDSDDDGPTVGGIGQPKKVQWHYSDYLWEDLKTKGDAYLSAASRIASADEQAVVAAEAAAQWDRFHERHKAQFYKKRRYLCEEFPELKSPGFPYIVTLTPWPDPSRPWYKTVEDLADDDSKDTGPTDKHRYMARLNQNEAAVATHNKAVTPSDTKADSDTSGRLRVLEIGCGTGSNVSMVLDCNPHAVICATDFSATAVDLVKAMDFPRVTTFTYDLVHSPIEVALLPEGRLPHIVLCTFVLCAISPRLHAQAISHLFQNVEPGGIICFRDHGLYDMAMLRSPHSKRLDQHWYVRADGTANYYFQVEETIRLFEAAGFTTLECFYCCNENHNRRTGVKLRRVFVHGKFLKPVVTL